MLSFLLFWCKTLRVCTKGCCLFVSQKFAYQESVSVQAPHLWGGETRSANFSWRENWYIPRLLVLLSCKNQQKQQERNGRSDFFEIFYRTVSRRPIDNSLRTGSYCLYTSRYQKEGPTRKP